MKPFLLALGLTAAVASSAPGSPRTSLNYSIPSETTGPAGASVSSASYSINGSTVSEFGAGATALTSPGSYTVKPGFAARLYDVIGLGLSASSVELNERASRAVAAAPLLDDATTLSPLDPSSVSWSILSGPIASVSADGVVTAATVYENTPGRVGATAAELTGELELTVLNIDPDDFGLYAGDQIDDDWQVQYFGLDNPDAAPGVDADGTGHGNLFKFTAGLNPLDRSRFTLRIGGVPGQPTHKSLSFTPVVSGRTYAVEFATGLASPSWSPLGASAQSDTGAERTVVDFNASPAPRFYRVRISRP